MRRRSLATALTLLLLALACASPTPRVAINLPPGALAQPWPEAEAAFQADARWLGGDCAATIDLGGGRVLWLFSDSFVSTGTPRARSVSRMVRNTIAIQHGRDPSRARLEFRFRTGSGGVPQAFFPAPEQGWYWPAHGARIGPSLLLFLHRVVADPGPLGFRAAGFVALRIPNPEAGPMVWRLEPLAVPELPELGLLGAAVVVEGESVYAFGVRDPGDHAVMLARWPVAAVLEGTLGTPEVWSGAERGFTTAGPAVPVMETAATELSVSRLAGTAGYLAVYSEGFPASTVVTRTAPALAGPWSEPRVVYQPPEAREPEPLVYAAKAHPELEGGDWIVTYAASSFDEAKLIGDLALYFPRFVRFTGVEPLAGPSGAP